MRAGTLCVFAALLGATGFLCIYDLDDRPLWGDEAETALLAVNITRFGLPVTDDGRNDLTVDLRQSWSNEDDIWIWSPWLDEYVAAGSFSLFGRSPWAARLPFALISVLTVAFAGWVAYRATENREAAAIAVLLLITCVPFLLLARQCRYYSLVMFAQVWLTSAFGRMCATGGRRGAVQLVLALAIQFYGNYIVVPANLLALCLACVPFGLRNTRIFWALLAVLSGFFLVAAPWLIYARPGAQAGTLSFDSFMPTLGYYIEEMNFFILPVVILLLPLAISVVRGAYKKPVRPAERRRAKSNTGRDRLADDGRPPNPVVWFLWSSLFAHLLFLGVTPYPFFRYICPLIPVAALLGAWILTGYIRWRSVRYALVALLAMSNVVNVYSAYPWRGDHQVDLPIVRFVSGLVAPYSDRLEDVIAYVNEHMRPGDVALAPSAELPLIFHTDLQIIDEHAGYAFFAPGAWPEWVFPVSACHAMDPPPRLAKVSDEWLQAHYDTIRLKVHDSPRGANRPDPNYREPVASKTFEEFVIYHKRNKNGER